MDRWHPAYLQAYESGWSAWRIAYGFAASNFSGWAKEQQLRSQTPRPEGPGRCGPLDAGGRHGRPDFPSELLRLLFAA